mmetsp:Transcript_20431/g.78344  ORF Transcript_20431/g.78344 Transcript_20431/m.78344 type:complete len:83 (+) Transcript_20431:778-1026(+)
MYATAPPAQAQVPMQMQSPGQAPQQVGYQQPGVQMVQPPQQQVYRMPAGQQYASPSGQPFGAPAPTGYVSPSGQVFPGNVQQ